MKIWLILTLTTFICLQADAEQITQWENVPSLPSGDGTKWRLVQIPEGTLAVNLGATPAAAFRAAGATGFNLVAVPPLASSWSWPQEITEAVVAPDGVAYMSCSSGVWSFTPTNAGWESVFSWRWDTSTQIAVLPNTFNISLVANTPPPAYLLGVFIRSSGMKSGYRIIHPGQNPNLVSVDAKLDSLTNRQLQYQGTTVAWYGYNEIHPGAATPAVLFVHAGAISRDAGQTQEPLGQGFYWDSKAGANSWLLRNGHTLAARFDGQQIVSLNFGGSAILSEVGNDLYISNASGTFRRVTISAKTYTELTGDTNPIAKQDDGRPAAIRWANAGLSLDEYYVSFELPAALPTDVEFFLEESGDLVNWTNAARSTGASSTQWEASRYLYFSTQSTGRMKVEFLRGNDVQRFIRMGVRLRQL